MAVMLPISIFLARVEKLLVEIGKDEKMRHGDKKVTSLVTNFVFYIALFVAFPGIHKYGLKTVVLSETVKPFRRLTSATPDYFCYDGFSVIKPQFARYSTNVPKDSVQPLQKAFHVFAVEQLQIAFVTVWE